MLSGKSLSIRGIQTVQDFLQARERCLLQRDLQTLILQEEIIWDRHITLWVEDGFYLGEVESTDGTFCTFYSDFLTHSGMHPVSTDLKGFLSRLSPLLKKNPSWILEIGLIETQIYLFQIQAAHPSVMKRVFSSELSFHQVLSRNRFSRSATFLGLLRAEWKALQFRNRMKKHTPRNSDVFLNWEFLFHYFRIFCMTQRKTPGAETFSEFLSLAQKQKDHLGSLIQEHLLISGRLREDEPWPEIKSGFHSEGPFFIGVGRIQGLLGMEILWQEEPDLASIYSPCPPKTILSSSVSLLAHSTLACAERGIGLVLGVPRNSSFLSRDNATLQIDFKEKRITLL